MLMTNAAKWLASQHTSHLIRHNLRMFMGGSFGQLLASCVGSSAEQQLNGQHVMHLTKMRLFKDETESVRSGEGGGGAGRGGQTCGLLGNLQRGNAFAFCTRSVKRNIALQARRLAVAKFQALSWDNLICCCCSCGCLADVFNL